MSNGKNPFQFGPRTAEQKSRNGPARVTSQGPAQPKLTPEQELRRRAVFRLDILPPYQGIMPQEMILQTEDGREVARTLKGLTKREYLVAKFVAAAIGKDGMPLQDAQCLHIARLAVMMSEAVLQTLSKRRGQDTEAVIKDLAAEAEAEAEAARAHASED